MAQQLWFLRHGEAEPHDARPDVDRRLTERGERAPRGARLLLAPLGEPPIEVRPDVVRLGFAVSQEPQLLRHRVD